MKFALSLVFVLSTFAAHAWAADATEHPRIWISGQAGIDALKKRVADIPVVNQHYQLIKQWAQSGDIKTDNLWLMSSTMASLVIAYVVENRDPKILGHIKNAAKVCATAEANAWLDPQCMQGLAFAYDWCHPDLTADEKSQYAKAMVRLRQQMESRWRHSDYNNHIYIEWGPTIYAGIALKGDGIEDAAADKMMEWSRDFIFEHGVKAVNQEAGGDHADGGWSEGLGYHGFFFYHMIQQWEAWRVATGEDPFKACTGLAGDATWLMHCLRPHDRSGVEVSDIKALSGPAKLGNAEEAYLPLTAARYNDGVAQYMLSTLTPSQYGFQQYSYVLWYDPSVKPVDPTTMPTARVFRGLGWASMRSSWDQDATFALLTCGDFYAGHQHSDQNQLIIHKLGLLAVDACGYGAMGSEYHNTIHIGGPQRPWGNDPIQRYTPIEKKSESDCGELLAWENQEPYYSYVCGEASNAYPKGKVDWFSRQVVFLRPDIFVVFDRTKTPEPQTREWLLHSLEPAEINKGEIIITNDYGRLWAKTILPAVKVSQEPITGGVDNITNSKISVVPLKNNEKSVNFLTVLAASSKDKAPELTIEKIGDLGVKVTLGKTTWQVSFGAEGEPTGHVTITEGGVKKCDRDLAKGIQ